MYIVFYLLPADRGGDWDHMWGPAGGWMWWWWGPLMMLLVTAAIGVTVWLVARSLGAGRQPTEPSGYERARQTLAERYARGELTTEEYRERLNELR